jgi:MoaA/NifB/PqqE/SkfB family radical SAM enzyme
MLYPIIDNVQFDLNVTCNAFCPGCHRYAFKDDKMYLNPYLTFNTSVDVSVIENIVQNPRLADGVWLDFVGLVGEPAAHKQFLEITDIIYKYKPNAVIQIHTNGGLRSTDFWKELAPKIMRQGDASSVVFSIDGLEDTNNTYRIGVRWEKVMENAKAYIDAGGRATWKCIEFPWNSHQKDEIEQLAKSMGMQQFRWEPNRDADSERMIKYMKAAKEGRGIRIQKI